MSLEGGRGKGGGRGRGGREVGRERGEGRGGREGRDDCYTYSDGTLHVLRNNVSQLHQSIYIYQTRHVLRNNALGVYVAQQWHVLRST